MNRRKLIITGACLIAAPAIVRAEWLMSVKVIEPVGVWAPVPLTDKMGKMGYWFFDGSPHYFERVGNEDHFMRIESRKLTSERGWYVKSWPNVTLERKVVNGMEHYRWIDGHSS